MDVKNLADHNRVIAAVVALGDLAFDVAQRFIDDCGAVLTGMPLKSGEFIRSFGREPARNLLLAFAQKIYREAIFHFEAGIASRFFINADQNQRRIEGERHESVGGESVGRAGLVDRGDDCDACGEVTHDAAQLLRIDGHACSRSVKIFSTGNRARPMMSTALAHKRTGAAAVKMIKTWSQKGGLPWPSRSEKLKLLSIVISPRCAQLGATVRILNCRSRSLH